VIVAGLERGLTAKRIWQDLKSEHGFGGDYQAVQRFVRRLKAASPLPFRRMESEPGAEAQVDFGKGAPLVGPDGKRRYPHLFRVVLSCSRKAYSEVVLRQTTEQFLRCIENAFVHFGGVPRTLIIDNLKAAVSKADWYDPELNPKVQSFAQHYGTAIVPTRPYTPRHKGKVERGVGYAQSNALRGRSFASLAEQNRFLSESEASVADTRVHGTTCRRVVSPASRKPSAWSTATATWRWTGHTTRPHRSSSAAPSGRDGTVRWCGCSTTSSGRSPSTPGTSPAASPLTQNTSPPRSAAASSAAPPGGWARPTRSGPRRGCGRASCWSDAVSTRCGR
jgi:transposase